LKDEDRGGASRAAPTSVANQDVPETDRGQNTEAGLITVPAFAQSAGVRHFFGTRRRPSLHQNDTYGIDSSGGLHAVVSVKQVHGTDALILDRPVRPDAAFAGGWDALVTNQFGVLLTIRTADCVPVLFHDPVRCVVAAVHAGWRGTVAGIVPKTIALMQAHFHCSGTDIRVAIGPSAGPCCYEVDGQVLDPIRNRYPYWHSVLSKSRAGHAMLNLGQLIYRQAQEAGVQSHHIWTVKVCTICHPSLFYSYRRDGVVKDTMVSGIVLTDRGDARGRRLPVRSASPIRSRNKSIH
jgi:YfiH family protein